MRFGGTRNMPFGDGIRMRPWLDRPGLWIGDNGLWYSTEGYRLLGTGQSVMHPYAVSLYEARSLYGAMVPRGCSAAEAVWLAYGPAECSQCPVAVGPIEGDYSISNLRCGGDHG